MVVNFEYLNKICTLKQMEGLTQPKLEYICLSYTISVYLDLYRPILYYHGLSRTILAYLGLSEPILDFLKISQYN